MENTKSRQIDGLAFLPVEIVILGPHALVKLVDVSAMDLSLGFFKDSVNSCVRQSAIKLISVDKWLDDLASQPVQDIKKSPSFIFHVSRCGSTLLCQNLKATQKFVVLGEPSFTHDFYGRRSAAIAPDLRVKLAKRFIDAWSRWAEKQGKSLVVKLSSSMNQFDTDIINDFPNSRRLSLMREPIAVLESLIRRPPGHLLSGKPANDSLINWAASSYIRNVEKFARYSGEETICVDYSRLKDEFESIIQHFDLQDRSGAYAWQGKYNAKSRSSNVEEYQGISELERRIFFDANRVGLEPALSAYHRSLEALLGESL